MSDLNELNETFVWVFDNGPEGWAAEIYDWVPEIARYMKFKPTKYIRADLYEQLQAEREGWEKDALNWAERLGYAAKRIADLESLLRGAVEDPTDFESEWNRLARAALGETDDE